VHSAPLLYSLHSSPLLYLMHRLDLTHGLVHFYAQQILEVMGSLAQEAVLVHRLLTPLVLVLQVLHLVVECVVLATQNAVYFLQLRQFVVLALLPAVHSVVDCHFLRFDDPWTKLHTLGVGFEDSYFAGACILADNLHDPLHCHYGRLQLIASDYFLVERSFFVFLLGAGEGI